MTTVFIAGSLSISRLHEKVAERITKVVASDLAVVVGDADGADTSIQRCLQLCRATKVTVYCAGAAPETTWRTGRSVESRPRHAQGVAHSSPPRIWKWRDTATTD